MESGITDHNLTVALITTVTITRQLQITTRGTTRTTPINLAMTIIPAIRSSHQMDLKVANRTAEQVQTIAEAAELIDFLTELISRYF